VPAHSADRSSSLIAAVAAPALEDELVPAMRVLPGRSAAGNDDLTATAARNSPAAADKADEVPGMVPSVSGAYIYGYDSAGNPTLTDVGYLGVSAGKLPE
jgi:hypothetical protein